MVQRAEALRGKIASERVDVGGVEVSLSCSFSVSIWQSDDDIDQILRRADDALYLAKRSGRNRVMIFDADAGAAWTIRTASCALCHETI